MNWMNAARMVCAGIMVSGALCLPAFAQLTAGEREASVGDAPANPGSLATNLSTEIKSKTIQAAMRKVADWQLARVKNSPSQDWTFAALYTGMIAASDTLHDLRYKDMVQHVAEHYQWKLGSRQTHADDQAIGQAYLALYREQPSPERIAPLRAQFDQIMQLPDDPAKPVWWWCDALFMAPPVWSGLATVAHEDKYMDYMDREWKISSKLLWDEQEHLFFRDASYLDKREKNGKKIFWSRGNGWVMGGLVRVLKTMPANDPHRPFYEEKLREMADAVARIQSPDGLWRPGLLDAADYPLPEVSGSAFMIYGITWGIEHHVLDSKRYSPVVKRGWAGLVRQIYADGRLGDIQPIGAAPGAYTAGASYVYGVGAFLLAGSEVSAWAGSH